MAKHILEGAVAALLLYCSILLAHFSKPVVANPGFDEIIVQWVRTPDSCEKVGHLKLLVPGYIDILGKGLSIGGQIFWPLPDEQHGIAARPLNLTGFTSACFMPKFKEVHAQPICCVADRANTRWPDLLECDPPVFVEVVDLFLYKRVLERWEVAVLSAWYAATHTSGSPWGVDIGPAATSPRPYANISMDIYPSPAVKACNIYLLSAPPEPFKAFNGNAAFVAAAEHFKDMHSVLSVGGVNCATGVSKVLSAAYGIPLQGLTPRGAMLDIVDKLPVDQVVDAIQDGSDHDLCGIVKAAWMARRAREAKAEL